MRFGLVKPEPWLGEQYEHWPAAVVLIIKTVTFFYLALTLLAVLGGYLTGHEVSVIRVIGALAAVLLISLTLIELGMSILVIRRFTSEDLLWPGWILLAGSACFQLLALTSQMIADSSAWSHLDLVPVSGTPAIITASGVGLAVGASCRFALLGGGLHFGLRAYHGAGLLTRPKPLDWVVMSVFTPYVAFSLVEAVRKTRSDESSGALSPLTWPVFPLLWLLLFQAILLFRSARQMKGGCIGSCWTRFSQAVFIVVFGSIGSWAISYWSLPSYWSVLKWYFWLPAEAAFAQAPVFLIEAMRRAQHGNGSPPL